MPVLPERLWSELERAGVELAHLEGSVRRELDGSLRGDRMMIERASEVALSILCGELGVPIGALERLRAAGRALELPLIAGWDLGIDAVKLYVNASDASERVRDRLAKQLDLPLPAHVVGVNVRADAIVEHKLYRQHESALELARSLRDEAAVVLAERVEGAGLSAGAVASFEPTEHGAGFTGGVPLELRAFFVALRPTEPAVLDEVLACLPGWSSARARELLPFEPGPPRSIGIAPRSLERWTAYFKPEGGAGVHVLEPFACFRAGGCEVGIYEAAPGERAYAVCGGLAIAYRIREGEPSSLRLLLDWVVASLGGGALLDDPPAPWERA